MSEGVFKIVFAGATVLYIWLASYVPKTTCTVAGDREIFHYGLAGIMAGFGYSIVPACAAWYLWRKKERMMAVIFVLMIVAICVFVMPQLFMERTELTSTQLIHRREPPHTRFNVDIRLADIASVIRERHAIYGFGSTPTWNIGYRIALKSGQQVELPSNTVLTAASSAIDSRFQQLGVPVQQADILPERD